MPTQHCNCKSLSDQNTLPVGVTVKSNFAWKGFLGGKLSFLSRHWLNVKVVEVKDGVIWLARLKVPSGVSQSQVISGKIVFETNFPMQPLLELPIFAAVEKQRL
jgi:hypothetical protein